MTTREEMLRRLRAAASPSTESEPPAAISTPRAAPPSVRLLDLFIQRATDGGATVISAGDQASVKHALERIMRETDARSAIISEHPLVQHHGISVEVRRMLGESAVLEERGSIDARDIRTSAASATLGIGVAVAGIADVGAVLIDHGLESRVLSLLPEVHVVLLPVSRIAGSLADLAVSDGLTGVGGSMRVVVGGPSKTADIEKVLVTGVHGPRALYILLCDDTETPGTS